MKYNLGDVLRGITGRIDEILINWLGEKLSHRFRVLTDNLSLVSEVVEKIYEKPVVLRGYYQVPKHVMSAKFGIDQPDEMEITLPHRSTIKSLGKTPQIGDVFSDIFNGYWVVVNRDLRSSMWRSDSRLVIIVTRFQENVTTNG